MGKKVLTWIKTTSLSWIWRNWLTLLIIGVVVGFVLTEAFSMADQMSTLNSVLNDKADEIVKLKTEISELEEEQARLNDLLEETQAEIERTTALFWSKFNKIKIDSKKQTPEEILEAWKQSWPGSTEQ